MLARDEIVTIYLGAVNASRDIQQAIIDLDEEAIQSCLDRGAMIDNLGGTNALNKKTWAAHLIENNKIDTLWNLIDHTLGLTRFAIMDLIGNFPKNTLIENTKKLVGMRPVTDIHVWGMMGKEATETGNTEFLAWILEEISGRKQDLIEVLSHNKKLVIPSIAIFDLLKAHGFKFCSFHMIFGCLGNGDRQHPNPALLQHMLKDGLRIEEDKKGLAWSILFGGAPSTVKKNNYPDIIECARLLRDFGHGDMLYVGATLNMLISIELGMDPAEAWSKYPPEQDELDCGWSNVKPFCWAKNSRDLILRLDQLGIDRELILEKIRKASEIPDPSHISSRIHGRDLAFWISGCRNMNEAPEGWDEPEMMALRDEALLRRNTGMASVAEKAGARL